MGAIRGGRKLAGSTGAARADVRAALAEFASAVVSGPASFMSSSLVRPLRPDCPLRLNIAWISEFRKKMSQESENDRTISAAPVREDRTERALAQRSGDLQAERRRASLRSRRRLSSLRLRPPGRRRGLVGAQQRQRRPATARAPNRAQRQGGTGNSGSGTGKDATPGSTSASTATIVRLAGSSTSSASPPGLHAPAFPTRFRAA